jgi:hypothetical protein
MRIYKETILEPIKNRCSVMLTETILLSKGVFLGNIKNDEEVPGK